MILGIPLYPAKGKHYNESSKSLPFVDHYRDDLSASVGKIELIEVKPDMNTPYPIGAGTKGKAEEIETTLLEILGHDAIFEKPKARLYVSKTEMNFNDSLQKPKKLSSDSTDTTPATAESDLGHCNNFSKNPKFSHHCRGGLSAAIQMSEVKPGKDTQYLPEKETLTEAKQTENTLVNLLRRKEIPEKTNASIEESKSINSFNDTFAKPKKSIAYSTNSKSALKSLKSHRKPKLTKFKIK